MSRYQNLINAYAQRDAYAVALSGIVIALMLARWVIARNPLGLSDAWQRRVLRGFDAYLLLAYVGTLAYGLIG